MYSVGSKLTQKPMWIDWRDGRSLAARLGTALPVALLILAGACAPSSEPETPSGWVTLDATLSVENLPIRQPTEEPVSMRLADAQARAPFKFGIPAWTPEGFALQDEAEVVLPTDASPYASVLLTWQNADEEAITLQASVNEQAASQLTGAGTTEQVRVNDQPATLTRLGLRDAPRRLSLSWNQNGVVYTLTAGGGVLSAEESIRMAESIQP